MIQFIFRFYSVLILMGGIGYLSSNLLAQSPQSFKYQTILRNLSGQPIANRAVRFQLGIQRGMNGPIVYQEQHSDTTNAQGLAVLEVGRGTLINNSPAFSSIRWDSATHFLALAFDSTGNGNFLSMGSFELLSVPYALFAQSSGSSTPGPQGLQGIPGGQGVSVVNMFIQGDSLYSVLSNSQTINAGRIPSPTNSISGGYANMVVYSTPGSFTWTKPNGVSKVLVECWGGGASGGQVFYNNQYWDAGGGGGGYARSIVDISNQTSIQIQVGQGGRSGASRNYPVNFIDAGGSSSFGTFVSATGGQGANALSGNVLISQGGTGTGQFVVNGSKGGSNYQTQIHWGGNSFGSGISFGFQNQSPASPVSPGQGGIQNGLNNEGGNGRVVIYY